ncbi:MAG: carbamoyltransferase HypF [Euryarchaeota archaeon]|nr:carbamoyltransferase HypF [Euryarchaeota archaeon]
MRLAIYGVVQGVGFRPTVCRVARRLGLNGHVRNNGANVEVVIDGDPKAFVRALKLALPPLARIDDIVIENGKPPRKGFHILQSSEGEMFSEIPPDTALCPECLSDIAQAKNRRHSYPFTNCTNCGARFSVVSGLPYDRRNTTMSRFKICKECAREYAAQDDRRFHHQTISCPTCGPRYTLYDKRGRPVKGGFERFAALLDAGMIGVLKGWGGSHLCCIAERAHEFRKWYRREAKPFAVMARDERTVKRLFSPTREELGQLTSPQRPIVLVGKRLGAAWVDALSPGLGTVGVMLPYSGAHHVLFSHLRLDALIMTSANPPGAPMYLDDKVFELGADAYMLHDRGIANRCDDSVLKMMGPRRFFIRRSRGHVPGSFAVPWKGSALALGAEENVTCSVAANGKLAPGQYIGDAQDYDVLQYLEGAAKHMMGLRGVESLDAVAIDLHPGYATRALGEEIAEERGALLVEVQHHHAHALSLAVDAGDYDEMAVLALDGTGYGDDGTSWGGEVLVSSNEKYTRVGHLQPLPLPGGDAAVIDPRRFLFAIQDACGVESSLFEGKEAELLRKLAKKAPRTSSAGRVLDALSFHLGACERRTYDGEPAMRLEPLLERGKPRYRFEAEVKGGIVQTLGLFQQLFELKLKNEWERADAPHSFVRAMTTALTDIAIESAERRGIRRVGLTGGVSYSIPIARMFEERVRKAGLEPVFHQNLPNGDGGISVGQAVRALDELR